MRILCPTCGKGFIADTSSPMMPFCSEQCKLIDMGRWMNEEITIPCDPSDGEDGEEPQQPEPIRREWNFD